MINRRSFLKSIFGLAGLPRLIFQEPVYTFGGWMLPVGVDCLTTCNYSCLQFVVFTGNKTQRDLFLSGENEFKSRGWYVFAVEGILTGEEVAALQGLFEECAYDYHLPIIQKN